MSIPCFSKSPGRVGPCATLQNLASTLQPGKKGRQSYLLLARSESLRPVSPRRKLPKKRQQARHTLVLIASAVPCRELRSQHAFPNMHRSEREMPTSTQICPAV